MKTLLVSLLLCLPVFVCNAGNIDTLKMADGSLYVGCLPDGKGVLYAYNGDIYKGDFTKGVPHGECTHYASNDDRYHGQFVDGKYSGLGRLFSKSQGEVIAGYFADGAANGYDTIYNDHLSAVYIGMVKDGKHEGYGKEYYRSGYTKICYYFGEYKNGKKTGKGELYRVLSNGQIRYYINGERLFYGHFMNPPIEPDEAERTLSALLGDMPKFQGDLLTKEELAYAKNIKKKR